MQRLEEVTSVGNWGVFETDEAIHVVPISDTDEHIMVGDCGCEPSIEDGEHYDRPIITHNSFDGREVIEWFNETLSQ